jgi:hypothetical protein
VGVPVRVGRHRGGSISLSVVFKLEGHYCVLAPDSVYHVVRYCCMVSVRR